MSVTKTEVVTIDDILVHPNADRLEIAQIKGWQCIVPKGQFSKGSIAVYIPIDSILPDVLESYLFPTTSKVKLHNHRIRTVKLRGLVSQGLLISVEELVNGGFLNIKFKLGDNLSDHLGIKKYEPPEHITLHSGLRQTRKYQTNPNFHKYVDIENYKHHTNLFELGEMVWILEKVHGTNFRAAYVQTVPNTLWKKVKDFFGLLPKYEFVYGSHNVQLQDRIVDRTWYRKALNIKNVYLEAVEKYGLRHKLRPGETIYGEIYGDNIQKLYLYGCKTGERKLVIFDWQVDGQYLDHDRVVDLCLERCLPRVPALLPIPFSQAEVSKYVVAPSWMNLDNAPREGIVIKPEHESMCYIGRKILKWKNDEFLLSQVDDIH